MVVEFGEADAQRFSGLAAAFWLACAMIAQDAGPGDEPVGCAEFESEDVHPTAGIFDCVDVAQRGSWIGCFGGSAELRLQARNVIVVGLIFTVDGPFQEGVQDLPCFRNAVEQIEDLSV